MLLKHETRTGEHTVVVFYSLYMHLVTQGSLSDAQRQQLCSFVQGAGTGDAPQSGSADMRVWRKQVLGFGGRLYDQHPRVHFEIFTTNDALDAFWTQDSLDVAAGGHGSDDVYGDMHAVLPEGAAFRAEHPQADSQHRIALAHGEHYPMAAGQKGAAAETLHVSVRLANGKRIATTWVWRPDAVAAAPAPVSSALSGDSQQPASAPPSSGKGTYVQLGHPVEQPDYEYTLYALATALYPDCPVAGFEWLRFGRTLGSQTTTHAHDWQLIRYAEDAIGYVDLADPATNVTHLSDADFPYWQGWKKVDAGRFMTSSDLLYKVDSTLELLGCADANHDNVLSAKELADDARRPEVANKLRHLVIKSPTEWDDSDLATRYAREKKPGGPLHAPASWTKFKNHVHDLAFWSATAGLDTSLWHVHPLQFVHHMRKSGWLTSDEMIQLFPQTAMREAGHHWVSEQVNIRMSTVQSYNTDLNKACRRYGIVTPLRMAAFYANAMQETMWFQRLHEDNPRTRYWPWDGRGFLQLTWPDNYIKYWRFIGKSVTTDVARRLHDAARRANQQGSNAPLDDARLHVPVNMRSWRDIDMVEIATSSDSAGAYWAWSGAAEYADIEPINQLKTKVASGNTHVYYTSEGMGRVAATVNLGHPSTHYDHVNGIVSRFQAYNTCEVFLLDTPVFPVNQGDSQPTPKNYNPRRP